MILNKYFIKTYINNKMITYMYSKMYEMRLKTENSKKEAEELYKKHLRAERRAYCKQLKRKRLKAEIYLLMREHLEKLFGKEEVNKKRRKDYYFSFSFASNT